MGPGTYTSMTQVAAVTLELPVERVRFSLGRSIYPPAPAHGGSMTMASVGSAVRATCLEARRLGGERASGCQWTVMGRSSCSMAAASAASRLGEMEIGVPSA